MGRKGRSTEALVEAQALLILARQAGDRGAIAFALTCNAWSCLQLGYAHEGIDCAVEAKSLFCELGDDHGSALSGAVYSWMLLELGLSDLGFEAAGAALEIAERTDDLALRSFVMCCKGMTLLTCRQNQLATPILEDALELADRAGDDCTIALNLINIAYSLFSQAELAESDGNDAVAQRMQERGAMVNDRAIAKAGAYGDLWNLRVALCNGAEYYSRLGDNAQAEIYLSDWEKLGGRVGPREQIHYLYTRGEVLTRKGQFAEALDICREAVHLAGNGTHLDNKANTLRRLAEVEAALGDFENAYAHFRAHHEAFVVQMGDLTRRRAQIVEMQLQNERLRAQAVRLEVEAREDVLTGLPNRRAFELAFKRMQGSPFALAMLDLDHFKLVNDRFSHLVGDAVLARIGGLLRGRDAAMHAFRLGGEEFALLIPGMHAGDAAILLETIRLEVASARWDELAPGLTVTMSIGVVDSSERHERAMLEEADMRLYSAKAAGRNCVVGTRPAPGKTAAKG